VCGPFVHSIDPVIGQFGPFYLWWYGASYSLGFLGAFYWIKRERDYLAYDMHAVFALMIIWHIPAIWLGGMSTHGIILGGSLGIWWFSRSFGKDFLPLVDTLAIAAAYIMGVGRLGNFIDGQIAGGVTEVCWAVQFPDLDGYRHPVVLYDGIKNLLLVPLLLLIRSRRPPGGVILGHFVLWYGFLRIFVDLFREYRTELAGFPPGQEFNVLMTVLGIVILVWAYRFQDRASTPSTRRVVAGERPATTLQRIALGFLIILPLVMPSDWTQDVPERYGKRHPGLEYSAIYPRIDSQDKAVP
jgi:phosphatidylglycerol:prolipoprotein diacylglycerol transferase